MKQIELVLNLKEALQRDEFFLFYQPKIDFMTGKITGFEALIRWKHPQKGWVTPLEFIPLAERTGLIFPIGEWVLRTACQQAKDWLDAGHSPLNIAINLSCLQLYQLQFVELVESILEETGFPAEYLELEITESLLIDVHRVLPVIEGLKRIGVRISLDDFGTGYSSFWYLKQFPIDKIKIDQSFVLNCTNDFKDATIIKSMIAMAQQLNIQVIAEGVETKEQLIFLQQNLCNEGQGYLFSRPLPLEEFKRNFSELESIMCHMEIYPENRRDGLSEVLEQARFHKLIRQYQGMAFTFREENGRFTHKFYGGKLLNRLGLTVETRNGKQLHEILPHQDAKMSFSYYQKAWEGQENVIFEGSRNGVWYLTSLSPIWIGGRVVEVIGFCIDITERKKSDLFSVAGGIGACIAHEIRNPLTTIKGFLQLLKKEGKYRFQFDLMLSEIKQVEGVVDRFLTLQQPKTQISEININQSLQEVLTRFRTEAALTHIDMVEELMINLPSIYCDEDQIKHMLSQLLQNAVDAMPDGGKLMIQTRRYESNHIQICLIDNGNGIPNERLIHLGKPYYNTREKGIGLGLMICKKIVQDHGGKIQFKSKISQGTRVEVMLPIR